jgi:hypothetical protein
MALDEFGGVIQESPTDDLAGAVDTFVQPQEAQTDEFGGIVQSQQTDEFGGIIQSQEQVEQEPTAPLSKYQEWIQGDEPPIEGNVPWGTKFAASTEMTSLDLIGGLALLPEMAMKSLQMSGPQQISPDGLMQDGRVQLTEKGEPIGFGKTGDIIEKFAVDRIKKSERIRERVTEQKEPIVQLIKEGRAGDAVEKIVEMAMFEVPRLTMQIAMAFISKGGSLGFMGTSAAGTKYGALADEGLSEKQRLTNATATGAVEVLSEAMGTGRVIDKVLAGKIKKGAAKRVADFGKDMLVGSVSEGTAQLGENALDQMVGMDASLGNGIAEAMILGAFFDGGTSISGMMVNAKRTDRVKKGLMASGATEQEADALIARSQEAKTDDEHNEIDKDIKEVLDRNKTGGDSIGMAMEEATANEILQQEKLSEADLEKLEGILGEVDALTAHEIRQRIKEKQEAQDADTTQRADEIETEQEGEQATVEDTRGVPAEADGVQESGEGANGEVGGNVNIENLSENLKSELSDVKGKYEKWKYFDNVWIDKNLDKYNTAEEDVRESLRKLGYNKDLYHGGNRGMTEFDFSRAGNETDAKDTILGAFLTTDYEQAERYAGPSGGLGSVLAINAKVENPIKLQYDSSDPSRAIAEVVSEYAGKDIGDLETADYVEWKTYITEIGHDGIEIELNDGILNYVIFNENQARFADPVWVDNGGNVVARKVTTPAKQPAQPAQKDGAEKVAPKKAKPVAEKVVPPKKTMSLVGDDIATIRDDMDFEGLNPQEAQKNIDTLENAKKSGADRNAETVAAEVLKKPRVVTPEEHAGMVVRAGQISNEMKKLLNEINAQVDAGQDTSANQAKLDGLDKAMDNLTYAADLSKTEAGRALQIRKLRIALDSYELTSLIRRAKASKGKKLTAEEQQNLTNLGNEIEAQTKKIAELEKEITDLQARDFADAAIEKARKTRKTRKKEDIKTDRQAIKDELQALGYRVNDITGVTIESARLISKLAANYIEDGAQTLKEVTALVKSDLPDLSDKNIWDSIGGRVQKFEKRAKTDTMKRKAEIIKQAKLSGQLEDAFNRVFDPKRKTEPTSGEVTELKRKLGLLESAYRVTETDETVYAEKMKRIGELKRQIDGLYRDVKPSKRKESELIKSANLEIKKLLARVKGLDTIADLEQQIRTGDYTKPKIQNSKSPALDDLSAQIKFLKEEIALRTKGMIGGGKVDAQVIVDLQKSITKVKDQIDKGYRNLPIPVKQRGARVAEFKKDLSEVISTRDTLDKIADLEEQIRTGNYKITSKEKATVKSKELADARIKLHQLQREARNNIHELRPRTMRDLAKEVITLPRSMLATMDMSYGLRQGLLPSLGHPVIAGKAWGKAFQATFSQNKADAADLDIKNHPQKAEFDKYGLHLSNIDSAISKREEFFASNLAEKIPGFGKVVMASERNMVTGLNMLRTGLMSDFLTKHPDASDEAKKAYAKYVNIATGRGDLGNLSGAAEELSLVFFAPRFALSRVQAPYMAVKNAVQQPELRGEMARQWGALLGTGMAIMGMAVAAGAEVGLDPDDSDFGKIIIQGNKRIDIWGGVQQPMRILAKTIKGIYEKTTTGETDIDPLSDIGSFLKYKLAPPALLAIELITGKDIVGREVQPIELGDTVLPEEVRSVVENFIPLIIQSAAEAYKEGETIPTTAALAIGEGLGLSIGVYDK